VGTAAIPEWAWQLRGAPRGVVRLELSLEKKASAHFRCLADTLQRELVVYRKGAIAKAFLARKTNESRIVDNGRERLETDADHRPLVSVNPDSVAELAPGALNAQPLRFANGNSKLPAQPVKTDSDAWIRRADELLAKHPSANYHRASELYQFATSMLSTLWGGKPRDAIPSF